MGCGQKIKNLVIDNQANDNYRILILTKIN